METVSKLDDCRAALLDPNVQAFLRVIRNGESSQDDMAYRWLYGSTVAKPILMSSFADHPRVKTYEKYDGQFIKNGKLDYTTAAGAYQIVATTWDTTIQSALSLPDFTPASQDLAAVYLLIYRKALDHVLAGRFAEACAACQKEWVSMPGANVGDQPTKSATSALAVFRKYGGKLNDELVTRAQSSNIAATDYQAKEDATAGNPNEYPQEQPMIPALLVGLASSLIDAFMPLAKEKLTKEIARHTDRPEVADQVSAAIIASAQAATGKSDPIEAVAAARADKAAMDQVQTSALDEIAKMAPVLDRLASLDAAQWAAEEASRATARQHNDGEQLLIDMPWLKLRFIHLLSLMFVSYCGWFVTVNWKDLTPELRGAVITLMIIAGWNGVRDYWMGSSRSSSAKDAVIDELSKRRQ